MLCCAVLCCVALCCVVLCCVVLCCDALIPADVRLSQKDKRSYRGNEDYTKGKLYNSANIQLNSRIGEKDTKSDPSTNVW